MSSLKEFLKATLLKDNIKSTELSIKHNVNISQRVYLYLGTYNTLPFNIIYHFVYS